MSVQEMISTFIVEIMDKQRNDQKWYWEHYVDGPISDLDANTIMNEVGCWCYDPTESSVKFYVNQNHPRWRF